MKHCRRNKLTVADIERVFRLYHIDKLLDRNTGKPGVLKSCLSLQNQEGEKDEIVPVSDILESDIPDLPLETTFTIDWLAINGKQINFIKDFDEDDDNTERPPDIQLLSQSIHLLSFECELYLKNIKDRMYIVDGKNTEIFHQLQIDDGLKQICPYLVHWIQSKVQMIMKRKPADMLSYLEYLIQVIHSLLMNRHLHIVSYVSPLSPLNPSCTSSFPACSRAAWARPSAPRAPTTTGSCASVRRSSWRRSIDNTARRIRVCRSRSSSRSTRCCTTPRPRSPASSE